MIQGLLCAIGAGLLWGLVFVTPLWLSDYPAMLLSFARYTAFGLIAMLLAWFSRESLRQLKPKDWWVASQLSLVGNIIYYCGIAAAVQMSGAPLTSAIIGTLPVVIAVTANLSLRGNKNYVPFAKILPALTLLLVGLVLVNLEELSLIKSTALDPNRYWRGIAFACLALIAWTWYPLRNSRWLRANPQTSSSAWATAQGLTTLPLALFGLIGFWIWLKYSQSGQTNYPNFDFPFGPKPQLFIGLMLLLGFAASWLGTVLWNRASQLLPPSLAGQLIVFETLAALGYAFLIRGSIPALSTTAGIALLIAGVVLGVRAFQHTNDN